MLIAWTWCFTFLTCLTVNGQTVAMAEEHAKDASHARWQRTSKWIRGPR